MNKTIYRTNNNGVLSEIVEMIKKMEVLYTFVIFIIEYLIGIKGSIVSIIDPSNDYNTISKKT